MIKQTKYRKTYIPPSSPSPDVPEKAVSSVTKNYSSTQNKTRLLTGVLATSAITSLMLFATLMYGEGVPFVQAQLVFKNFMQHTTEVSDGITTYEYSSETVLTIDDDTEFDDPSTIGSAYSGSYTTANFEAGVDDIEAINDTTDYLRLNHYGDNEPDTDTNGDWWDDDATASTDYNWRYRRCFDVDHTATGASNLTDFQVYVEFDSETLIADGKMDSSGDDIRFVDEDDNSLDYYINQGIDTVETGAWILMDNIDAATTETVCMYYGYVGAGSATAVSDMENVFTYSTGEDIYYVVNPNAVGGTGKLAEIGTYTDNNDVTFNGTTTTLTNAYDTTTFNASAAATTDVFNVEGPIHGAYTQNVTDAIHPISWAGTGFVFDAPRGTDEFVYFAPYGDADVDLDEYNGTTWTNLDTRTVTGGTQVKFTQDVTNARAYRITSDEPILAYTEAGNNDARILYPYDLAYNTDTATYVLYGVAETARVAANTTSDCDVDWYASDGGSGTLNVNSASFYSQQLNETTPSGTEGHTEQLRVESTCPIGALSYADSDGGEAHTFLPKKEWDSTYLITQNTQYASMSMEAASTDCRMYNASDVLQDTDTSGTETYPSVNLIYIPSDNNTADTIRYTAGYYMQCDAAVTGYYENRSGGQEETQWLNAVQGRKGTDVLPSIEDPDDVSEEGLYYESGRDSGGADTDPEAYMEIIVDGTSEHVYWHDIQFTATLPTEVSTNSVDPIEVEAAYVNSTTCTSATYGTDQSVGTASPSYFDDEYSDNQCLRLRVYLRTGDEAYTPELEEIILNYTIPTELEDVLNTPDVSLAATSTGTAIRKRILKLETSDASLLGSDAYTTFRSVTSATPFNTFDVELLEIPSGTVTSQFSWPTFPGSETDATNSSPLDASNDLAVYVDQDLTAGATETIELRISTDVEDTNGGPYITRDFDLDISS